jgi:hypothetical protein
VSSNFFPADKTRSVAPKAPATTARWLGVNAFEKPNQVNESRKAAQVDSSRSAGDPATSGMVIVLIKHLLSLGID